MLLVKINAEEDTLAREEYRVSGYPTTVLIDKEGEDIDRITGYRPTEEFIETLVNYSRGIGTLDDLLRRAETEEDRELYYEIANKYKYSGGMREAEAWFSRVVEAGEPRDSLSGMSRLGIADMYRRAGEYDKSLNAFAEMAKDFESTMFEEVADIYIAIVYNQESDTTNAIAAFRKFVDKYPESEDAEYAREKLQSLENPPETVE
jgi:tetratricopeptide (TPR) repeat protein